MNRRLFRILKDSTYFGDDELEKYFVKIETLE